MGNNLLFSFIPKTTMNVNDVVDLTASLPLFVTQPNITYCRGLHENIYFNSITEIISETRIIITMKEIVYAGETVKFECSKGLRANSKFSTKVMFDHKNVRRHCSDRRSRRLLSFEPQFGISEEYSFVQLICSRTESWNVDDYVCSYTFTSKNGSYYN